MSDLISEVCEILSDLYPMDGEKVISIKELDKAYDKIINLRPTCNQLATDCVSKQAVIKAVDKHTFDTDKGLCLDEDITCILEEIQFAQPEITEDDVKEFCKKRCWIVVTSDFYDEMIQRWSSTRLERDIPMKPNETTDSSWGIRKKQAVCPKCDYYLGRVEFIGNPNGKKVTYCETCGQAIDWEGWDWEE